MTEREWIAATSPNPMYSLVCNAARFERKHRLLACAWCRHTWDALADGRSRRAVEAAELYADGLLSPEYWAAAREQAYAVFGGSTGHPRALDHAPARLAWAATVPSAATAAATIVYSADRLGFGAIAVGLYHDIFGPLPFRDARRGAGRAARAVPTP